MKQQEVWNKLDAFLNQTFTRADGTKLKITCAAQDTGGHFTNEVYKFTMPRYVRGIRAIKGKGGSGTPFLSRKSINNRYKAPFYIMGVDTGKALIYQRLTVEEEGANYCHFPKDKNAGYTVDYFKGLTSERMVTTYKQGRAVQIWKMKENWTKRNEPLDCRNYALAALEMSGVVLKKPEEQGTTAATGKKRRRRVRGRGI